MENSCDYVKFNISGTSFTVLESTLFKSGRSELLFEFANSNSSERKQMADGFIKETGEFFFQRSPEVFSSILSQYWQGELHKPTENFCSTRFKKELDFWQLPFSAVSPCCSRDTKKAWAKQLSRSLQTSLEDSLEKPAFDFEFLKLREKPNRKISAPEQFANVRNSDSFKKLKRSSSFRMNRGRRDALQPALINKDTQSLHKFVEETREEVLFDAETMKMLPDRSRDRNLSVIKEQRESTAGLEQHYQAPDQTNDTSFADILQLRFILAHPENLEDYKNAGGFRRRFRNFLEDPSSSKKAKIFSLVSTGFVVVSILGLILGSMEFFQQEDGQAKFFLQVLEIICITWFTLEYSVRFIVFPRKLEFLRAPLNIIDFLSIVPFYIELILDQIGLVNENGPIGNIKGVLMVIRILRIFRVARILKLARHSDSLQSFGETMKSSKTEFRMLVLYMGTCVLLFSSIMYYLENDSVDPITQEKSRFTSIPRSSWWCIVTMTTVGYGDIIPVTAGGQIVASLATLTGVIVLAFPITVIVSNFGKVHNHALKERAKLEKMSVSSSTSSVQVVKSVAII